MTGRAYHLVFSTAGWGSRLKGSSSNKPINQFDLIDKQSEITWLADVTLKDWRHVIAASSRDGQSVTCHSAVTSGGACLLYKVKKLKFPNPFANLLAFYFYPK
jgi:hypothetical protein